jgi:hypothetical protein
VGIVLLFLVFVLLEHESLRDRFIRLVGTTDIRSATLALNDAGERLSRFFVSQFAVNSAFALAIWLILSVLHVPQAAVGQISVARARSMDISSVISRAPFAIQRLRRPRTLSPLSKSPCSRMQR